MDSSGSCMPHLTPQMLCLTRSPPERLSLETVWKRSGTSKKYLDKINYFSTGLGRRVPTIEFGSARGFCLLKDSFSCHYQQVVDLRGNVGSL